MFVADYCMIFDRVFVVAWMRADKITLTSSFMVISLWRVGSWKKTLVAESFSCKIFNCAAGVFFVNVLLVKYWNIFKLPGLKVAICSEDLADSPQMWQCGWLRLGEKYDSFFPLLLDDFDDGSRLLRPELLMISFCCWSFSSFSRNLRSFCHVSFCW